MKSETNSPTSDQFMGSDKFAQLLPAPHPMARRSFLRSLGLSAALLTPAAAFLGEANRAAAASENQEETDSPSINNGDAAILRFLAAAELIETDLWQQYTELAFGNPAYRDALEVLDEDMPQYITDNTDDELSHATFLNAVLQSVGRSQANLNAFRTLPSSHATGAAQRGRLTNLQHLNVDTSWWIRYRSQTNPDFGATFPQLINITNRPAIPPHDFPGGSNEIQAIANTAAFHFATIEQGGSSLYSSLAQKVSNLTVLKMVVSIGGSEVNHFAIWHDKAGNAPAVTVPGVSFPDLESFDGDPLRQKNLIMPKPCQFILTSLRCSVIRPVTTQKAGAVAAFANLRNSGLFFGQSSAFFQQMNSLAQAADAAFRS
jgi:ferritin-like protein